MDRLRLSHCLILTVVCYGAVECLRIPQNPCPNVFSYKINNGYYYGELIFPNDGSGNFELEVNVSMVGYYQNAPLKLELATPYEPVISGTTNPKYYVYFPFQNVIPKLTRAQFNGRVFCSGPPEPLMPGSSVTNLWARTMLRTQVFNPQVTTQPTNTPFTSPEIKKTTTTTEAAREAEDISDLIDVRSPESCGIANDVTSLVVHGEKTDEGEFPWLAALMYRRGFNYEFRCTANLVSNKHIVTAAHCVQLFKAPLIQPQDMLVVLGKHNIEGFANGNAVLRDVKKVTVHPGYEQNTAIYDVAVITLTKTVEFSKTVRPICLWDESDDLKNIVGSTGTVAGWGKDETGANFVAKPKKVDLPVVSQETCLRSHMAYIKLTSENTTFCAGNNDGEKGPCTGDSGGGFMMLRNAKWTLRGIVSVALEDPSSKSCDLTKYFIFADVAKVIKWIKGAMT